MEDKITWVRELRVLRLLIILTFGMRVFGLFVDAIADCLILITDKYAVLFGNYFGLFVGDVIGLLILFFLCITIKELRWLFIKRLRSLRTR